MAFKAKNKNRVSINNKQTIDATHQNMLDYFNNQKELLPDLKDELEELNLKLVDLNNESKGAIIADLELQDKIWKLEDKITELKAIISNIENNEEENDYMINTCKLLNTYYGIQEEEKKVRNTYSSSEDMDSISKNFLLSKKKKTVMDWFSNESSYKNDSTNVRIDLNDGKKEMIFEKKKSLNTIKKEAKNIQETKKVEKAEKENKGKEKKLLNSKGKIYNKYMKIINKDFTPEDVDDMNESIDICTKCYVEMLLNQNTGMLICPSCGLVEKIIINSDKPSYKDPPKEQTSFCYKRINHLNEFLAQFQAKETTEIPEDVYNKILIEINKERIENMAEITPEKMKQILKKIKYNDYYEHTQYIINQLNGLPPPVISPEIEEIIRSMFKETLVPFGKHCPSNKRKNFLSYNYIMYKFFELLELDEYLHCFQLLKSRTKLHQQEQIWKNICKDLGWEYIPSL